MKSAGKVLLAMMPPTFAAASSTYSGRSSAKKRMTLVWFSRSSSSCVRAISFEKPRARRCRSSADPTRPRWPATYTRLSSCMREFVYGMLVRRANAECRAFTRGALEILADHHAHQVLERNAGFPPELGPRLGRVAEQIVDFRGAVVARIDLDVLPPVELRLLERHLQKFADAVRLAGGDDEIARRRRLQHAPHRVDVV